MIDTTLPNIGNRWKELKLPVLVDKEKRDAIKYKLETYSKGKWGAESSLKDIKDSLDHPF
jgi:type I restriction enzyme M protein